MYKEHRFLRRIARHNIICTEKKTSFQSIQHHVRFAKAFSTPTHRQLHYSHIIGSESIATHRTQIQTTCYNRFSIEKFKTNKPQKLKTNLNTLEVGKEDAADAKTE